MSRRRVIAAGAAAAAVLAAGCGSGGGGASPATTTSGTAGATTRGVTASTIRVGIPYVDLAALKSLGINLNQGNFAHVYTALIDNMNAHGGVDGRKIVPYIVPVSPTTTTAALTACTQLVQDDQVFVAINPLSPECYLEHQTPVINGGTLGTTGAPPAGSAVDFVVGPPPAVYDPLQLAAFAKQGVFKGKKVGLYADTVDTSELAVVQASLKKLGVDVVQSAVNSAPSTDQVAANQQGAVIAERFKSLGVDEVVAVGGASSGWPTVLENNQSTYNPPWVATSANDLGGLLSSKTANDPTYLKNLLTSSATLTNYQAWSDPAIQKCVSIVRKAYPSDVIISPPPPTTLVTNTSDNSYVSVEAACEDLALFAKIAGAAGKNLTVASFTQAGYGLRNVTLPGSGGPVSFGPGQAYTTGPVFVGTYDVSSKQIVYSSKPAAT